jgi:hypothetical protein
VEPNDEFDGTQLDGCRWARSVRYNSHGEEVKDGHLKITTQPGDITGNVQGSTRATSSCRKRPRATGWRPPG